MKTSIALLFILVSYAISSEAGQCSVHINNLGQNTVTVTMAYGGGESDFMGNRFYHEPMELQVELKENGWNRYSETISKITQNGYIRRKEYIVDLSLFKDVISKTNYALLEYQFLPTTSGGLYTQTTLATCRVAVPTARPN
jgi:hypothetical protein